MSDIKIPCVPGQNLNVTRHFYPFDSAVIVQCNENGQLQLNRCTDSLHWNPNTAACSYEKPPFENLQGECERMRCQNEGLCEVDKKGQARCLCPVGFTGDLCETNIDNCASNPCKNNGTCVDGINRYFCICPNKYIDKSCSWPKAFNPCAGPVFNFRPDKNIRFPHPYTKEKFLVCNAQKFAQVMDCPEGLVWLERDQLCGMKSDIIQNVYFQMCMKPNSINKRLSYAYSRLKYVVCNPKGYEVKECPIQTPFFCEKRSICVQDLSNECHKNFKNHFP